MSVCYVHYVVAVARLVLSCERGCLTLISDCHLIIGATLSMDSSAFALIAVGKKNASKKLVHLAETMALMCL